MSSFMKSQGKSVIKHVVKARFELPSKKHFQMKN